MASFDTSRTTYGTASAVNRLVLAISDAVASIIAWNDGRVTRKALSGLTDRELEDIGLSRSDIDSVAVGSFIR